MRPVLQERGWWRKRTANPRDLCAKTSHGLNQGKAIECRVVSQWRNDPGLMPMDSGQFAWKWVSSVQPQKSVAAVFDLFVKRCRRLWLPPGSPWRWNLNDLWGSMSWWGSRNYKVRSHNSHIWVQWSMWQAMRAPCLHFFPWASWESSAIVWWLSPAVRNQGSERTKNLQRSQVHLVKETDLNTRNIVTEFSF